LKFGVLALDYDGTIARDGVLDSDVRASIAEARGRGIIVVIVTGRILPDLKRAAGDLQFVDAVVAENGALLAFPNGHSWLIAILRRQRSSMSSVAARLISPPAVHSGGGRGIGSPDPGCDPRTRAASRALVQPQPSHVLPQGISKATGLRQALTALRLSAHNAIAIGDAENDNELLAACEIGVAVGLGSPALQRIAAESCAEMVRRLAPYIRRPQKPCGCLQIGLAGTRSSWA